MIGSKNFTEQVILGEMLAQHLEAKTGLHVERRFYLAGTYICHQALLAGRIDAYVEYTGTALTAILKQPVESDPGEACTTRSNGSTPRASTWKSWTRWASTILSPS